MRSLLALVLVVLPALGQDVRPWPHERSDLAPQPGVVRGHLENGLRFAYVRQDLPRARVWFTVAAGSVHEAPGQEGLAHVLEHLVFRGTENWTAEEIERWAAEQGLASGPDLNAFTDDAHTSYLLDLPQPDAATMAEALEVLRELTTRPTLLQADLDAERPIVDAEERERGGPDAALELDLERFGRPGLRGGIASVMGTRASRDALTAEDLRAFHRRWYRPERCTLVLAGDLPEELEALIDAAFGDWRVEGAAPEEPSVGALTPGVDPVQVIRRPGANGALLVVDRVRAERWRPSVSTDVPTLAARMVALALLSRRLSRLERGRNSSRV